MDNQNGTGTTPQKILIIDDQILFREGLMSLLRSTPDFEIVGCAGGVHEGCELAILHKPDIILMDYYLPDGTGLDATRAILARLPNVKIVFLSVFDGEEVFITALHMGAKGYMPKNVSSTDLLSSLRALRHGEMAISRKMMSVAMNEFSHYPWPDKDNQIIIAKLSPRELDILREIQSGASNSEIAEHMFLSVNTVKHHIRNILTKLEMKNRRQAAAFASQVTFPGKIPQKEKN